jgi:FG-GAP-like repeat/Secretion system C-terminal sorting domain
MKKLYISFFLFYSVCIAAQQFTPKSYDFEINGKLLKYSAAGGLNAPQFNTIDLNNDGKKDLLVFDRIGNVILPFINGGTPNFSDYSLDLSYVTNFPKLTDFVLLRDYNGDGIEDIFTYSDEPVAGIRVFKGKYVNNKIAFERFNFSNYTRNIIPYASSSGNLTNLYVAYNDIPAIDDMDGDGDLDILTFEAAGGNIDLYLNKSIERGWGKDSLRFDLDTRCWGGIFESGLRIPVSTSPKPDSCMNTFRGEPIAVVRHPGSTLWTYDKDNDGDKELILGDVSFDNFNMLTNAGTKKMAWINEQDNTFPSNSLPLKMSIYPAAFMWDIDNDNKKDMLVAPNAFNAAENYNNVWLYKNEGTQQVPIFNFKKKTFLTDEMIDLGSGAHIAIADINADGLDDIIVGNISFYQPNGINDSRLFYYKNIGTKLGPKYKLENSNWLDFAQYNNDYFNFAPTFGDMDNDGDLDIIVGEEYGTFFYSENKGGTGNPMQFNTISPNYAGITAFGSAITPQIFDVNNDGKKDIISGERNGNLNYFENIGTLNNAAFASKPTNALWGNIDVRNPGFPSGHTSPYLINSKNGLRLYCGTEVGDFKVYDNIAGNINGTFNKVSDNVARLNAGEIINPVFHDLDNNGYYDLIVGNLRGGINFYNTDFKVDGTISTNNVSYLQNIKINPNPTNNSFRIQYNLNTDVELKIVNGLGKQVFQKSIHDNEDIEISNLIPGVYFVVLISNGFESTTLKLVKL